jgi:hypothetical protein
MTEQLLDEQMDNFNKVKDIILTKLVDEKLIDEDDANEFRERCQVLLYKGNWFKEWFGKNKSTTKSNGNEYYIRIIEMHKKEDDLDRLLRRTTGDYEQ